MLSHQSKNVNSTQYCLDAVFLVNCPIFSLALLHDCGSETHHRQKPKPTFNTNMRTHAPLLGILPAISILLLLAFQNRTISLAYAKPHVT